MHKEALRIHLEAIMKNTPQENWVDNIVVFISVNFPLIRGGCNHIWKDYGVRKLDVCTKCNEWKCEKI